MIRRKAWLPGGASREPNAPAKLTPESKRMYVNILHRPQSPEFTQFFCMQQDWAHTLDLSTTVMMSYPTMQDSSIVDTVRRHVAEYGDDLGLFLSELKCPAFFDRTGLEMDAVWLYSADEKRMIYRLVLDQFRELFEREPTSLAAYHLDIASLKILLELCPALETAVAGCFEERVRVFHGCNNSWYLFNEGMPWWPWWPSKNNSLRPAAHEEDALGIVCVPHLSRDMVLSYETHNDYWATHPGNVMRGLGYEDGECPYSLNLIDEFLRQEQHNGGYSYINVFVGPSWLTWSMCIDDDPSVQQKLHYEQYEYLARLQREGRVTSMTLTEYGRWHRQHRPVGNRDVYHAHELIYGAKKEYFWYLDPDSRVVIDATQGGSIGDLRPYVAKIGNSTGSDSPSLYNGSYPYLVHSQHRTGIAHHFFDGSRSTVEVTHGEESVDLCLVRTKIADIAEAADGLQVTLTPARMEFACGLMAEIITSYRFLGDGRMLITRQLSQVSDPQAALTLREYVKACYGTTEYPEDLHGIQLVVKGDQDQQLDYAYRSRVLRTTGGTAAVAVIPQLQTELRLEPIGWVADEAEVQEGCLFGPFYVLAVKTSLKQGESIQTCLSMSKAK